MSSLFEWLWKLLGWLVQYIPGWPSWWERRKLRGIYEQATQGAHPVDSQVRQACLDLLRKTDFFACFAYPVGVPVDQEFQEFLHRLQDRLPADHADIKEELLSIYGELATLMFATQSLAEPGKEVRDFLRRVKGCSIFKTMWRTKFAGLLRTAYSTGS